jgi:hypothetical protein
MRTTLDIADDVLQAAKERARRENKTAGQVISEYGLRPIASRGGLVTNELIDKLGEDDAY